MKKMKKVMHVNLNYEKKKRICKNKTTKEKKKCDNLYNDKENMKNRGQEEKKRKGYSSLLNRRDVTSSNFLRIFPPQLCYFSHHIY